MKFTTLKAIEKLLQEDLIVKEHELEQARKMVRDLKQDEDEEKDGFNPDNLKYWEDSRKRNFDRVTAAKDALNDFLEHDWR